MKKIVVALLIMAMSTSLLIGCGGNNADNSNTAADQEADVAGDEVVEDFENDVEDEGEADLYGYVAPTELGAELASLTFQLEGVYYQFPMPVSELLANGWEIPAVYQTEELVAADAYYDMALENVEGQILYEVRVKNTTGEPQKVENCLVNRMLVVADQEFDFVLPEGIGFDSTEDELKAVTVKGSIQKNGNYTTCVWDNEAWTDSITAWYHPEIGVEYFEMMGWY